MQRPIPDVFHGSTPAEITDGSKLGSEIEFALGGSALLFAFGAWVLTSSLSGELRPWLAIKVGFGVLLAMSLLGLWLRRKVVDAPQRETMGIYQAVLRRMPQGGGAVRNAPMEKRLRRLVRSDHRSGIVTRRTQAGRAKLEVALRTGHTGLLEGRRQAQRIAAEIGHQAKTLSDASLDVRSSDLHLVHGAEEAGRSLETVGNAVTRAVDGITTIAASIRATTTGAQQMTAAAVQMAEVAHGTHRCIAALDDKTAAMVVMLDTIERALQIVASLGQAGCREAVAMGEPASPFASIALELQEVVGSCQPALTEAGAAVRELVAQTTEANRRTMEIAEFIGATHDIGRAVGQAVEQQGQEIARILTELYEARPGLVTLRAGVDAITLASTTRTDANEIIRNTARKLPTQAENLANVLRGLPDLTPRGEY